MTARLRYGYVVAHQWCAFNGNKEQGKGLVTLWVGAMAHGATYAPNCKDGHKASWGEWRAPSIMMPPTHPFHLYQTCKWGRMSTETKAGKHTNPGALKSSQYFNQSSRQYRQNPRENWELLARILWRFRPSCSQVNRHYSYGNFCWERKKLTDYAAKQTKGKDRHKAL